MALRDKWKSFGKNTGKAFSNFGHSFGKTMKVALADDENKVEENGHTELGNAWRETGKSFGRAGKSLGKAAAGTAKKVVGEEDVEDRPNDKKDDDKVVYTIDEDGK